MIRYVLLLGSNLGDSVSYLIKAVRKIETNIGHIISSTEIIVTDPIGEGVHTKFFNQAVVVDTDFQPENLLDEIENIERVLGRNKPVSTTWDISNRIFEDRIIDIDIALLDLNGCSVFKDAWNSKRLRIPHNSIQSRPFVKELLKSLSINL